MGGIGAGTKSHKCAQIHHRGGAWGQSLCLLIWVDRLLALGGGGRRGERESECGSGGECIAPAARARYPQRARRACDQQHQQRRQTEHVDVARENVACRCLIKKSAPAWASRQSGQRWEDFRNSYTIAILLRTRYCIQIEIHMTYMF